ncbi:MAG TPA: amino acid permease [Baekduia sp.]|uniref:amino acid permease n=1 Tax=Baekduia sp. TaxID=2600305 RepID=UPI002CDD2481|nr:amino acid permease [Baekduia sp.]HMJ32914.1 amino acid permease [Baekduia sp.]
MAERRLHGLQRVLGVNALFSTAYGNVGSSIYYALGLVASFALGLTPVVFVITGFIFYLTAATYAEATAMYPEAGGSSSFARHAFNEFWSFFAAWAQMLNYTITIAISAFFVPHYVGGLFWDELRHGPGDIVFAIGLIGLLSVVNVRGVKESAGVNVGLALVDFMTQLLLVAVGFVLVFSPSTLIDNVQWGIAPTWKDFFIAIPVGMIAYTGIETISNMAEEAKDEEKTIPAAINRVVIAVFAIYSLLPMVALSALPVFKNAEGDYVTQLGLPEDQGGFAGDPVLGVVKHFDLGFLQAPAELYVGVLAATILIIASNAGIIGVSRLVYSMGIHRQVPDRMRQLHPKYGTPYIGIAIFGVIACLAVIPGKAAFLGNMYAFGAMLSFTIAHLAVIRLRLARPDARRPWRGPGNIRLSGGRSIPLFAVFGGLGTGLAFVVVTALHLDVALAGISWLALGCVIYPIYRRRQGLDLTTTTKVAVQRPVVEHEAEYESVLVALDASQPYPKGAIATAAKVAARRRRGIHVLVYIAVPQSAPIDADLPEAEQAAESIIEQARLQGGRRVTGHLEKVRPGQAGRMIVQEARELEARAIVAPLPPRTGGSLFGKTLETVLAERPCRVIIQSDPAKPPPSRTAPASGVAG